jgi:hypothetical protein
MPKASTSPPEKPSDETPELDLNGFPVAPATHPNVLVEPRGAPRAFHLAWFASTIKPPQPGLVAPLLALAFAAEVADEHGSFAPHEVWRFLPAPFVQQQVAFFLARGWCLQDGERLRIVWTPPRTT